MAPRRVVRVIISEVRANGQWLLLEVVPFQLASLVALLFNVLGAGLRVVGSTAKRIVLSLILACRQRSRLCLTIHAWFNVVWVK